MWRFSLKVLIFEDSVGGEGGWADSRYFHFLYETLALWGVGGGGGGG